MALPPQERNPAKNKPTDRKNAENDVFAREVDEALRQDEMVGFLNRFGLPLAALVTVGLLGFGGYLWWQHRSHVEAGERSEAFVQALDDLDVGNLGAADKKLVPLADADSKGAVAAKLLRAGIALEEGRAADAAKIYSEVAADPKVAQPYRDLATVRAAATNFDAMKPQDVIDRLKPLAVPGNPWFGVAGELVGVAYLKQGKEDLAGPLFAKIAREEEVPETLRTRTRQLAGLLGVDAIDDVIEDADSGSDRASAADQGDSETGASGE